MRTFASLRIALAVLGFMWVAAPYGIAGVHEGYSFRSPLYNVCNHTTLTISIAFGWETQNDWITAGWWKLAPGECQRVFSADSLPGRRGYYATATDANGDQITWEDEDSVGDACVNQRYAFVYYEDDQYLCGFEDDDDWVNFRYFPDRDISLTAPGTS